MKGRSSRTRESLNYVSDRTLEEHIRKLEAKIADIKKSQSAANALWEEGRTLNNQSRLNEALSKFKESLKLWSSPDRAQFAKDFEAQLNQKMADAKRLRAEGETFQNQKRYEEAINRYRASLKLWPDSKLEAYIKNLEVIAAKEKGKKETADRLWNDGKGMYDQKRLSDALNKFKESLTYWPDQARAEYVKKMETEKAKAKKLREEGDELQNQGKLPDAIAKYRESLKYWPDSALEGQMAGLEAKAREQEDRKTTAKRLRDEGYTLQQRSLIREAIAKYTESLTYWPDAELEKYIRQLETKLTQDPVKPPQPVTPFDLGRVWRVKQRIGKESWTWVWTRRGDSNTFDGAARHDQRGTESRHVIDFVSEKAGQVIFSRPDAYGKYIGTLSPDGKSVVSGFMDSISHSDQGWTATIESDQSQPVEGSLAQTLGRVWRVVESGPNGVKANGTWTRRGSTNTFDAAWQILPGGAWVYDTITIESVSGDRIVLFRKSENGHYVGTLSPDRKSIVSGTMSWNSSWSWTANIDGQAALYGDVPGKWEYHADAYYFTDVHEFLPDGRLANDPKASWALENNQLKVKWANGWLNVYNWDPQATALKGMATGPNGERVEIRLVRTTPLQKK
jgi:tetratricopeptide (TPR) repeat protein